MNFFKQGFFVFLSSLLLIGCTGSFMEALHDGDEQLDIIRFNIEKDDIYFFGLTADKKIAVLGKKYYYLLEEQNTKDKQLIAKLVQLPFKQHIYSQIGVIDSTKEKPSELTTELYVALDTSKLNKKQLKTATALGFKNSGYKTGLYSMAEQYKNKIDLRKLDQEKKIWHRKIQLVGYRYLPKEGENYVVKNHYPFSETVEIHTNLEKIPTPKGPKTSTILLTPFAALADVATGILAAPAYIGLQAVCIGQSDGFICK